LVAAAALVEEEQGLHLLRKQAGMGRVNLRMGYRQTGEDKNEEEGHPDSQKGQPRREQR
jgi:hypothetical protein